MAKKGRPAADPVERALEYIDGRSAEEVERMLDFHSAMSRLDSEGHAAFERVRRLVAKRLAVGAATGEDGSPGPVSTRAATKTRTRANKAAAPAAEGKE